MFFRVLIRKHTETTRPEFLGQRSSWIKGEPGPSHWDQFPTLLHHANTGGSVFVRTSAVISIKNKRQPRQGSGSGFPLEKEKSVIKHAGFSDNGKKEVGECEKICQRQNHAVDGHDFCVIRRDWVLWGEQQVCREHSTHGSLHLLYLKTRDFHHKNYQIKKTNLWISP